MILRRTAVALALVCMTMTLCTIAATTPPRPNIMVILSDDMGYSDIGCYGGEIDTPNLDSLAANGLRFTQFYNAARCCPTRASLLTGLYPHQTGIGHMTWADQGHDGYRGDLNSRCVTIAEVLRTAGYGTYAVGKWHVCLSVKPDEPRHNWPLQRGFDDYYGLIWGSASFFDPAICRRNNWHSCESDPEYKPAKFYLTNAVTDNTIAFLQRHRKNSPDKPFFMYVAYTAAHWPMHALEKDIAKYRGRFEAGYDKLRQDRVARLRKLGLVDPRWEVTPTAGRWDDVKNREWEMRCMEVYAAMVDCMDQGIGRIVAELRRQGQLDNTLILFLQDNGGCAEDNGRKPDKKPPPEKFNPLRPEELPAKGRLKQTRDGRPVRVGPDALPGGDDTWIAYGQAWANVSNTPFREYKHWVHEGGISTPLIVHWPAGISRSRNNSLVATPGHLVDIMATCVDVAQGTYPAQVKGQAIPPMQGVSLRPVFEGKQPPRPAPLFWEHEGNRAVRDGRWKLVAKESQPWELYDMESDRTEMHDLATSQPQRVKELAAEWDAWAARSNVLPLGAWHNKPVQRRAQTSRGEMDPAAGDQVLTGSASRRGQPAASQPRRVIRPGASTPD